MHSFVEIKSGGSGEEVKNVAFRSLSKIGYMVYMYIKLSNQMN